MNNLLIDVNQLSKHFHVSQLFNFKKKHPVIALDNVSFSIAHNECFGVVGESGCGKSTLGRCLLNLIPPSAGTVTYLNQTLTYIPPKKLRHLRKDIQIIYQDPYSSLNPQMTIEQLLTEPLDNFNIGDKNTKRVILHAMLNRVGLDNNSLSKHPHQFSGGQRQRIMIARALITQPKFVVCDEPVSALDVSVRSQILNLMKDIKEKQQLSYLFISHDLSVVKYMADRIAVMYLGEIVELTTSDTLYHTPLHPYTQSLIAAIPSFENNTHANLIKIKGEIPSAYNHPKGCKFHTRCPYATEKCRLFHPELKENSVHHLVRCHLYETQ